MYLRRLIQHAGNAVKRQSSRRSSPSTEQLSALVTLLVHIPRTAEALKWLHRSAGQGFLPAIDDLGEFYWLGSNGVPQDNAAGIKYLRKAADRGLALAQYTFDGGEVIPERG